VEHTPERDSLFPIVNWALFGNLPLRSCHPRETPWAGTVRPGLSDLDVVHPVLPRGRGLMGGSQTAQQARSGPLALIEARRRMQGLDQ